MGKYSKLIGSIIGGVIGIGFLALGVSEDQLPPLVDTVLPAVLAWFGTYIAPANTPSA